MNETLRQMLKDTWDLKLPDTMRAHNESFAKAILADGIDRLIADADPRMASISAVDQKPFWNYEAKVKASLLSDGVKEALMLLPSLACGSPTETWLPFKGSMRGLCTTALRFAELYGKQHKAKSLRDIRALPLSDASFKFSLGGQPLTYHSLFFYLRYAFCCPDIDFASVESVIEIGPGSGRAAALLKSLYPDINFYLFDTAPQLYISYTLLARQFGGAVLNYERDIIPMLKKEQITLSGKGALACLPPQVFERIRPMGKSILWANSACCCMAAGTVESYLKSFKRHISAAYFHEPVTAETAKGFGILDGATLETYKAALAPELSLIRQAPGFGPYHDEDPKNGIFDLLFVKRALDINLGLPTYRK